MRELVVELIKKALEKEKLKLKEKRINRLIEIPPSHEMGDYAFPCFIIAAELKQEPHEAALYLRAKIGEEPTKDFDSIQVSGPYVNFFVNRKNLAGNLIKQILREKKRFGKNKTGEGQRVMVEFSNPNTHKAFHVGHIRGTSLGESLVRIMEFSGSKVVRANYNGDAGMHVAKWIWCYEKYHAKEKIVKDESWVASIYVDAVKRLAKNKKLQKQVDEINLKLGTGEDKKLNSLWKKTRKISLDSLEKVYKELNTHFDAYFFESKVEKRGREIVDELLTNKIARISDGALIVNLKKYKLGVWVLLRKDGTALYSTKDLALAEAKFKKYKLDKSIYVVANEQNLHLNQLFKTLGLMKFKDAGKSMHVSFGMIRLPGKKMSSRTGENILYSTFLEQMMNYAGRSIKKREKAIKLKELNKRALTVSIAAMKYTMLKQGSNKDIVFDPKEAINFEGDTGPYLLYSYARAGSILKKARGKTKEINKFDLEEIKELKPKEVELIKKFSQFPKIVLNAYNLLNPALIANYSYQLAQTFNEFYHQCPVIGSDEEAFRLSLVESFRHVIKNALNLLGIETLEKM
ncbi:arginine--tRNA ligase [Nanoarchaeota archaeon]